jgi:hypothetical protein
MMVPDALVVTGGGCEVDVKRSKTKSSTAYRVLPREPLVVGVHRMELPRLWLRLRCSSEEEPGVGEEAQDGGRVRWRRSLVPARQQRLLLIQHLQRLQGEFGENISVPN